MTAPARAEVNCLFCGRDRLCMWLPYEVPGPEGPESDMGWICEDCADRPVTLTDCMVVASGICDGRRFYAEASVQRVHFPHITEHGLGQLVFERVPGTGRFR